MLYCCKYCRSCDDRLAMLSFAFEHTCHVNLISTLAARFGHVGTEICTWVPHRMQRYCGGTTALLHKLDTSNCSL